MKTIIALIMLAVLAGSAFASAATTAAMTTAILASNTARLNNQRTSEAAVLVPNPDEFAYRCFSISDVYAEK